MSATPTISQRGVPSAVRRVLAGGRVWIIQGVGTLLVAALAWAWFWIDEARVWQIAASILLALFVLYLAAFLQRTALRVYRRDRLGAIGPKGAAAPQRRTLRQWLPGAVLVFVFFAVLVWGYGEIREALPDAVQFIALWLTLRLRSPVDPYLLERRWEAVQFLLPWLLFVVLWLPLAAAALLGESGIWRAAARAWLRLRYWLGTLVCAAVGYYAFTKLSAWVPSVKGIAMQSASMAARLALAYVIALGSWLVILALAEESISAPRERNPHDTWD